MLLVEPESAVNHQVRADKDGAVALARAGCRARSVRLVPGHHLQVQYIYIVEEIVAVPTAKDNHLRTIDKVG